MSTQQWVNLSRFATNITKVRIGQYNTLMITADQQLLTCGAVPQSYDSVIGVQASSQISTILTTDGMFIVTRKSIDWVAVAGVNSI